MLKLSPRPFRLWNFHELPEEYQLDSHESDNDTWIKKWGQYHNLSDFCTVSSPIIPLPCGGAQTACGEFMIASYRGEIYGVYESVHGDETP